RDILEGLAAQGNGAAQVLPVHARRRTQRRPVIEAAIDVGVAVDHDRRRRLCDRDGYRVVLIDIVAVREAPGVGAARDILEGLAAQGNGAAQVLSDEARVRTSLRL